MNSNLSSSLPDYHLHTPLCRHAVGSPREFAAAAVARGFTEIGFADHAPTREALDDWRMLRAELPRYLELIEEARAAHPQLRIRLGLEVDWIAGQEDWIRELAGLAPWDFLIGSVHYIAPGWDVDNPRWIGRFAERPVAEIWELYAAAYEQCIRSGLFDWVAHPDLPKKFGHRPGGDLGRFYGPWVRALAEMGGAFEINTAGLRKAAAELYPAPGFLELAHAAGVPLVISSDAHAPGEIGAGFPEAVAAARAAGYGESLTFARRERRRLAW